MKVAQDAVTSVQTDADALRAKHTAAVVMAGGSSSYPTKTASTNQTHPLNSYPHQADNVSASSAKPKLDFQSNLLDSYDVVTYHWKLFIVSTETSSKGEVMDLKSQIVIAESGVTDLTIDNVEIRTIAVPTIEIGTGTSTNVKFEIVEPSGAGLLDKLFYEAISLGIGNWTVMPIYLQLEFRGRDPETSNADANGTPGSLANLKWLWPLKVSEIKASVTEVGTRYNFQCITYNEMAQTNSFFNMQHNLTLTKLDQFGLAMAELADVINLDQYLKTLDNYSIPDVYKIVVDPAIYGHGITPANGNANPSRANSFVTFNGKTAQFNANTSIDKIIDTLLAHTDKYQTAMTQSTAPGNEGSPASANPGQMKKFWRIVTETRPIGYDVRSGRNAVEITIFIIDYDIAVLDANTFQTGSTKASSIQQFVSYVNKSILRKKYNYMFTGLNDQIKTLNLTFNNAFATAVTRMGGIYLNSSMASKGVVTNTSAADERAVTEKLSQYIRLLHNPAKSNSKELLAAETAYKTSIKTATLTPEARARFTTIAKTAKPADARNYLNNAVKYKGTNIDGSFNTTIADAKSLATPLSENIPAFVSDINLNSVDTTKAYTNFLELNRNKLRPMSFTEQAQNTAIGPGLESNSNSGVNKLASLFSVALHSGMDANLVNLRLTIKGDPFWLAPGPLTKEHDSIFNSLKPIEEAIRILKSNQKSRDYVNVNGTDNFIVIRFRTPRIFNVTQAEDTVDPQTEVEMFSGVYKVITVTHKFVMGTFVQDMECILDSRINLSDISHLIEADAQVPTTATTVGTFSKTEIPETAQPTSRILGASTTYPTGVGSAVATVSTTAGNTAATLSGNIPSSVVDSIRGQTKIT